MPCRALALALTLLLVPATAHAAVDRTKPTTPTNLRVTAVSAGSVSLAWNASTDNSGSVTYSVRESSSATYTASQTQFTWPGLQPSRTYRFVVSAVDAAGNRSPDSNQVTVTTLAAVPPAVPGNLRVAAITPNTASVAWDAAANATRYEVRIGGSIAGTSALSYTAQWLQADTSYAISVRSFNAAGAASAWSAPLATRTPADTAAPSAPSALVASATGPSSLQLAWAPSSDDSLYVSYNVYVDGRPSIDMLPPGPTSMDVLNLRDGTAYNLSVVAYDAAGNMSSATHITAATPESPDTTPPATPGNLTAGWLSSHSVPLSWNAVGEAFAYEIWVDGAFAQQISGDWRYGGMLFSWGEVRHLAPGSTHTFTVRARDEGGNLSAPSAPLTVTLPASSDTTPPAPPTGLVGDTSPNCAFAFFSWTGGGGEAGDVEIFEDGHYLGVWRDEAFMTSFGRHAYTVRYVDRAGNASSFSPATVLDHGNHC